MDVSYLDDAKFFDGMDDFGSELTLQSLTIIVVFFLKNYLNSPLLSFMIINLEMLFQILDKVEKSSRTGKMAENHPLIAKT